MHLTKVFSPLEEFRAQLEQLRGHPMPPISDSIGGRSNRNLTQAMVFRIVNIVVDRWTKSIKDYTNLSFNEGRILILLELYGSLNPSDIARRLYIAPSNVAVLSAQLRQRRLLETLPDADDGRRKTLRCTTAGLRLARELLSVLRKATRDCYISYTDPAIIMLNAQHMRMYCELDKVRKIEQNILSE